MGTLIDEKMESHERTPLIATVRVAPRRERYTHSTVRRFCTIALGSTLVAFAGLFLFLVVFTPTHHRHRHEHWGKGEEKLSYKELQQILLDTPDAEKASEWSKYYTSGPHLAGKNYSQVLWTQEKWQEFGIQADVVAYDTYINYPLGHRLVLYEKSKAEDAESWSVKYEATLEEDVLEEDPTSGLENRIPTFHGYSASGNVTAQYVYVNYGTYQDFEDLVAANVSLEGKIALAKYGGIFRGLKVKRAQDLGMVGVVIFTDPGDDGQVTEENGTDIYPDGPARNPSSVQRGSTQFLSVAPGDPTTPGYPSKPGVPRQPVDSAIPSIPSIPLSYAEAIPILKTLNGHGPGPKDFNKAWQENLGLKYKGVEYNVGPSPEELVLNLVNEQEYVTTPLWNVIGVINGTLSNEVIVIGNHRDAWVAGGAGDPNSGSAALNEVIRSFGVAISKGWKPLRTIVFASWDGEEYGLIGSTEWVEEYLPWLNAANVAYVNVDVATVGPIFKCAASPLLNKVMYEIADLVQSPNQTVEGQTVGDLWDHKINTMGSGSDFTAFQDFAGIPSIDFGFGPDPEAPGDTGGAVYHYHSNYDSYHWMATYGDPGFHYHVTVAKLWGLFTARLAEAPVVPLNATDYAIAIEGYISNVESKLDALMSGEVDEFAIETRSRPTPSEPQGDVEDLKLSFKILHKAASHLLRAAKKHDAWAAKLASQADQPIPWYHFIQKFHLSHNIAVANKKYKYLERQFLYQKGLDGRSWFKHVIFAPGLWTGYAGAVFPGLVEAVDNQDFGNARRWVGIIEGTIFKAARSLH
ncbi:related to glutamate carboxypeptidase II [Phialocephala subalpina]|uniref:Related to glutamate carboxypeptidase II n=1 Tax=Phialocephala subalpina TaxID=576137 RepID=A0A1L7WRH3_9HELO|nr:related to glutamate carboxypeptidase II [Phialocephala subalpina]